MKGLLPLFIGLFGTFAFSWLGLTVIPNLQIGQLDPQSDEEGTDIYPLPKSGMVERGRRIYAANGCIYCHSQQVRPDYAASDIDRKWGERRSAPRDYIFDRPVQLGKERMGPDLANVGKRAPAEEEKAPLTAGASVSPPVGAAAPTAGAASPPPATSPAAVTPATATANASPAASPSPSVTGELMPYSAAWHHRHLYSPRSINDDSNMPAYRFLYEKRLIGDERSADALQLTGSDRPPAGWEIVPTYDAKCLVAYLMSLDQSHPLNEVKTAAAAASPSASPAAAKATK
jgi:cytochrome c oxidase cbb3-type subunit 2